MTKNSFDIFDEIFSNSTEDEDEETKQPVIDDLNQCLHV